MVTFFVLGWVISEVVGKAFIGAPGSAKLSPITQDIVEKEVLTVKTGKIKTPPSGRLKLERVKQGEVIIIDEGADVEFKSEREIFVRRALFFAKFSEPVSITVAGDEGNFSLNLDRGKILLWTTADGTFIWCFSCKGKVAGQGDESELSSKYLYLLSDGIYAEAGGKEFDRVVGKVVKVLESERFLERADMPPKSYPNVVIPPESVKQYPKDIRAFWEKFRERSRARGEIPCSILLERAKDCVR